jgi:hypothetical protein
MADNDNGNELDAKLREAVAKAKPRSLAEQVAYALTELRCGAYGNGYVYALRCDLVGLVKIGRADVPQFRIADLERMNAAPLRLVGLAHGADFEGSIQRRHVKHRKHGEWFAINDNPLPVIDGMCLTCRERVLAECAAQR